MTNVSRKNSELSICLLESAMERAAKLVAPCCSSKCSCPPGLLFIS